MLLQPFSFTYHVKNIINFKIVKYRVYTLYIYYIPTECVKFNLFSPLYFI